MADFELSKSAPFAGCDLPIDLGAARLSAMETGAITSVMPFKGQMMGVAKNVKAALGLTLPKLGEIAQGKTNKIIWFAPGQWLVFGEFNQKLKANLDGLAATTDQTGAWEVLSLTGSDAPAVMARLCPLDISILTVGFVARSEFAHVSAVIIPHADGFDIAVPRSYANTVIEQVVITLKSLAAQALIA